METVPWDGDCETYEVLDRVWAEAGMTPTGGRLCIACLERRIRRRLMRSDFTRYSLRNRYRARPSDRLLARMLGDGNEG